MRDHRPGFFKFFLPSSSSERLHIPLAFAAQLKGRLPDKVFLKNRHGKLWQVEVTKVGNDYYLNEGWVKFVEDVSVEPGDFLVFDYDGNCVFNFKLLGRTACDKEVIGSSELKDEEEEDKEEEEDDNEEEDEENEDENYEREANTIRMKSKRGKSEKSSNGLKVEEDDDEYDDDDDDKEDELYIEENNGIFEERDEEYEEEELEANTLSKKGNNEKSHMNLIIEEEDNDGVEEDAEDEEYKNEEDDDDDDIEESDEGYKEEEECEANTSEKKKGKRKSEESAKRLTQNDTGSNCLLDLDGYRGKSTVKVEGGHKRNDVVTTEDGEEVFEYGMVSRPKNPYFVTKRRTRRPNELYVPVDVIRDHKLKLPQNLDLLDEEGRKWSSRVVVWKDGRTWLTGGWRAFCRYNSLNWEDRCICEFIKGKGRRGVFLKMCILRAGSWLPKRDQSHG